MGARHAKANRAARRRGARGRNAGGATAILLLLLGQVSAARADHDGDWEAWSDGEVRVHLRLGRGEGAVHSPGEPVRLAFASDADAYHLLYAIDTDGFVRLLFPRWWEDDGWLQAGAEVELGAQDLAWPASRWGTSGIVYVEVLASPVPFDFAALELSVRDERGSWRQDGRPLRIEGDPFLAFNDIHQLLFPRWDEAVFAADYSYFYVREVCAAPRYLGFAYQRVYLPPPAARFSTGWRFGWSWEFGSGYCRPVYARYYVPGVHVVHHPVYHHHHVVYTQPSVVVPAAVGRETWLPRSERLRRDEPQRLRERRERQSVQHRERQEVQHRRESVERRAVEGVEGSSGGRRTPESVRRVRRGQEKPVVQPLKPDQKAKKKQASVPVKERD